MKHFLPFLALLLASCGEVKTGGFETSDLQARVVHPDGRPAAAARVWLVRSRGDSAPALALDSSWADMDGLVRFSVSDEGTRELGLDVQRGDSLGIAPSIFSSTAQATIVLAAARKISVRTDSGEAARLFVPGSHFASRVGADGSTAEISLPQGTWNLAVSRGQSAPVVTSVEVRQDSIVTLPLLPSTPDAIPRDLAQSFEFNFAQDTVVLGGRIQVVDKSFLTHWSPREDTLPNMCFSRALVDTMRADSIDFSTFPGKFPYRGASVDGQYVSEASSAPLPTEGTILMWFQTRDVLPNEVVTSYLFPFHSDSGFFLQLSLEDGTGSGARITLDSRAQHLPDSFRVRAKGAATVVRERPQHTEGLLSYSSYSISWNRDSIWVGNIDSVLGIVKLGNRMSGPPIVRIGFGPPRPAPASKVSLRYFRLYRTP